MAYPTLALTVISLTVMCSKAFSSRIDSNASNKAFRVRVDLFFGGKGLLVLFSVFIGSSVFRQRGDRLRIN